MRARACTARERAVSARETYGGRGRATAMIAMTHTCQTAVDLSVELVVITLLCGMRTRPAVAGMAAWRKRRDVVWASFVCSDGGKTMAGITLVVLAATSATAATRVAPACAWHGVPSHARVSAFPVRRPCPPAVAALGARRARPMLAESCTPVVPARPHGGLAALLRVVQGAFYALWLGLCSRVAKGIEEIRKSSRPAKIFLVRHGQSRGNVDETLYSVIADHDMELTELGREQARCAGRFLRAITGDGPVHCFHSPYRRASQTLAEIIGDFDPAKVATREEVLLREQEFGNFQDVELIRRSKAERRRYGRFWYRFQNGESGADVHNRAADFLSTLFRQVRPAPSARAPPARAARAALACSDTRPAASHAAPRPSLAAVADRRDTASHLILRLARRRPPRAAPHRRLRRAFSASSDGPVKQARASLHYPRARSLHSTALHALPRLAGRAVRAGLEPPQLRDVGSRAPARRPLPPHRRVLPGGGAGRGARARARGAGGGPRVQSRAHHLRAICPLGRQARTGVSRAQRMRPERACACARGVFARRPPSCRASRPPRGRGARAHSRSR